MAEMIEVEKPGRKKIATPDVREIARDLEHDARILQESGRVEEANNLRAWAKELRQKNVRNPF